MHETGFIFKLWRMAARDNEWVFRVNFLEVTGDCGVFLELTAAAWVKLFIFTTKAF